MGAAMLAALTCIPSNLANASPESWSSADTGSVVVAQRARSCKQVRSCREAVEITCAQTAQASVLGAGGSHRDFEDLLGSCTTFYMSLAAALFGDADRGSDVLGRVNQWGRWAGDVVKNLNRGAHLGYAGDLRSLINSTDRLCQQIAGAGH